MKLASKTASKHHRISSDAAEHSALTEVFAVYETPATAATLGGAFALLLRSSLEEVNC